MIKVAATAESRTHIMQLVDVFRARVVDVAPDSLIIEITGTEDKIDGLLEVLRPYGVLEMVRTGRVAMSRGAAQRDRAGRRTRRAPPKTITTYFTLFSCLNAETRRRREFVFEENSLRLCVSALRQKRTLNGSEDVLRQRRGSRADPREEGGHHRLRIAGARARAEPEGQRRAGEGGPRAEQQVEEQGRGARPVGDDARRSGEVGRRRHDSRAGHDGAGGVCGDRAAHDQGQDADVRARLQHPVRHREAVEGHRRDDDRAEGAGPSRSRAVRRRRRHARADRGRAGRDRQRQGACAVVCQGHRRDARGRDRDDVHRGDRDRSLRRAGDPLRRHQRAREGRASRRWCRPAISPRSRTSSASTS